ncbi:MAG: signal recognition particle-docking protein FtsY, partial [bacterium]
KTTTCGKLAYFYGKRGYKVVIAASDTFRAAAIDQVAIWAKIVGARLVKQNPGADPAAVAYDALNSALKNGDDLVIVDTAGRLHTKKGLMDELGKVVRVIKKLVPDAPHEVLLVIDAIMGQNALAQARTFKEAIGLTGLVITKLDGTARGGMVIPIRQELGLPVKFIGIGEGVEDLHPFDPYLYVQALFPN